MNPLAFVATALRDYRVGALMRTSGQAAEKIVSHLNGHKQILELGPGDGPVTRAILARIPPDGRCLAIELNKAFVFELEKINDPRFSVVRRDALGHLSMLASSGFQTEAVVSGIPFSFFTGEERGQLVRDIYRVLAGGGMFVAYQYHTMFVLPLLKKQFGIVHTYRILLNIPPYCVMVAEKR